ncbi:hypothetical protein [Shinella sp.]|uniref:hypothetical protein n=1 Tax=Shinella sp. TaxID=1870904 RepID=UPI00301C56A4
MTKTFNATFAAALVAASVFGASTAFAGGTYYVGGSPDAVKTETHVDTFRTNSVDSNGHVVIRRQASVPQPYDRGDYRPAGNYQN